MTAVQLDDFQHIACEEVIKQECLSRSHRSLCPLKRAARTQSAQHNLSDLRQSGFYM